MDGKDAKAFINPERELILKIMQEGKLLFFNDDGAKANKLMLL